MFTWACIISYYNAISRYIFPSENINSQFYKHMFQIICVLTQHNSVTCKNQPSPLFKNINMHAYEKILH